MDFKLNNLSQRIEAICDGRWRNLHIEYQDEGKFLLVSVESDAQGREMETIRVDLTGILKSSMPDRKEDYSWSAVIKRNGVVVESLMGGGSGSLPEL